MNPARIFSTVPGLGSSLGGPRLFDGFDTVSVGFDVIAKFNAFIGGDLLKLRSRLAGQGGRVIWLAATLHAIAIMVERIRFVTALDDRSAVFVARACAALNDVIGLRRVIGELMRIGAIVVRPLIDGRRRPLSIGRRLVAFDDKLIARVFQRFLLVLLQADGLVDGEFLDLAVDANGDFLGAARFNDGRGDLLCYDGFSLVAVKRSGRAMARPSAYT